MTGAEILQYLQEKWPIIVSYLLTILGYTLYFIVKAKVTKTGKNLTQIVKEKVAHVDKESVALRQLVTEQTAIIAKQAQELAIMMKQLNERVAKNERLVSIIADAEIVEEVNSNGASDVLVTEGSRPGEETEQVSSGQQESSRPIVSGHGEQTTGNESTSVNAGEAI